MTPERVELVGQLFEPYGNLEGFGPALELVEHVRELQAFVLDMAAHMDSPPSPEKTAEHYQLRARLKALREQITPQGGQR